MDVDFNPGKSIAELPISDPIHAPCPDMAAFVNFDPKKTKRADIELSQLREKYGFKRRTRGKTSNPLNFACTNRGCIEPWGDVNNVNPN